MPKKHGKTIEKSRPRRTIIKSVKANLCIHIGKLTIEPCKYKNKTK